MEESLAELGMERADPNRLERLVEPMMPILAGAPARQSQRDPTGCPIDRAAEAISLHETLQ
jgi:hypothetical protein